MSGWLAKKGVWSTTVAPGSYPLVVNGDTTLTIHVAHADSSAAHQNGPLHVVTPSAAQPSALIAHDGVMKVAPPAAPYTHPSQEPDDNTLKARALRFAHVELAAPAQLTLLQVWTFAYVFFTLWPDQEYFVLATKPSMSPEAWVAPLLHTELALPNPACTDADPLPASVLVSRAAFWQGAGPLPAGGWVPAIDLDPRAANVNEMLRAAPDSSAPGSLYAACLPKLGLWSLQHAQVPLYRRYIPELKQTLTFRLARSSSETDVNLVHRWHASERVNTGWRQDMPREKHREYLAAQEASPSCTALIGEWDGEPFGYLEIYHARQSNLRDFYDANEYDRGFHALVGEERFRGPHRVRSWMGGVIHLLFLLDPRTMRVVSEPRASNTKMVEYECMCGGHVEKLIDLGHKRAALVWIPRERFFQLCPMGPLPAA